MTDFDRQPAGFLVDLDGVLVLSHEIHLAAYEAAFAEHGLDLPARARRLVLEGAGRTRVLACVDVPAELADSVAHAKEEAFVAAVRAGALRAAPGAEAFVRALNEAGRPAVVVSNSTTARACVAAMGWSRAFRDVVGRFDVEHAKPDPEPFVVGAARLGLSPRECVAVEDSPSGAEAARAAGAFVVGVGAGVTADDVDLRVDDLSQLPLDRWLGPEGSGPAAEAT